jgi:hypothetical protein
MVTVDGFAEVRHFRPNRWEMSETAQRLPLARIPSWLAVACCTHRIVLIALPFDDTAMVENAHNDDSGTALNVKSAINCISSIAKRARHTNTCVSKHGVLNNGSLQPSYQPLTHVAEGSQHDGRKYPAMHMACSMSSCFPRVPRPSSPIAPNFSLLLHADKPNSASLNSQNRAAQLNRSVWTNDPDASRNSSHHLPIALQYSTLQQWLAQKSRQCSSE